MTTKTSMNIDPYERGWMAVTLALLIIFAVAVTVAGFAMGYQLPSPELRVDPRTVANAGPFAEPGLREIEPGVYRAYILAMTWRFSPAEIKIPAGSTVTFYVTSKDLQHGFKIQDTNVNMQILPGQVSKLTATFDKPGTYNYICTEFCGAGHAAMAGKIIVTEP